MCQVGVTAGSITRARAGQEATGAELAHERETTKSSRFQRLAGGWIASCPAQLGSRTRGARDTCIRDGQSAARRHDRHPFIIIAAALLCKQVRNRTILLSGGQSAGGGVDPFDSVFCRRVGGWSCLEEISCELTSAGT